MEATTEASVTVERCCNLEGGERFVWPSLYCAELWFSIFVFISAGCVQPNLALLFWSYTNVRVKIVVLEYFSWFSAV